MTAPLDEHAMALQAAVAGSFSLEREIGRGGMGIVYLARDVALDRPVAIKLLRADLALDAEVRARFLREAATAARLVHPHIIPVYDVGEHGMLAWIVMGYVDGESLADRLQREGPMPPAEVTRALQEVGWALAAAHAAGVLHRDVTLSNILLERATGRALLADFGLAEPCNVGDSASLVGTPEYLAPELLLGVAPTPRSDLYSLGVAGWALCTGHLPVSGTTPSETLVRRLQETPRRLEDVAPGLPRALRLAIGSAMQEDPAERPATLEAWLTTLAGSAPVRPPDLRLVRWSESGVIARSYYAFALSLSGMFVVTMWDSSLYLISYLIPAWIPPALAVAALAILVGGVPHLALAAATLRAAATAGFLRTDLRVALADATHRRTARGIVPASLLGRVVNDLAWIAGFAALATELISNSSGAWYLFKASSTLYAIWTIVVDIMPWLWFTWFIGLAVGRVVPARPEAPRSLRWRLREAFWNSWLGAAAFRLAQLGLGASRAADSTLHRPTEVMLQVGIAELCEALPTPQRRALREVPALADRLQQRIAKVRERIALLEAQGGAHAAHVGEIHDRLVGLRDEAIGVLERLRRDLLRLGTQIATTGPLTEQLGVLEQADLRLLQALRSIP